MNPERLSPPILITGCARSGTSMVAGSIHLCGAFGGRMRGPNKNNEKGMFENTQVVNQIVKPYLRDLNVDTMGQYPLPDINSLPIPVDWGLRTERIMRDEGYASGPWFYKGAKNCLIWPVWHYAFPNAKWVIVRRRTGDIVESCLRTNFMRAFGYKRFQMAVGVNNERDGWIWWVRQHLDRFREMIDEGLNVKIVWPERMVSGDYRQLMETIEWLGLNWSSEVVSFVDPKLWKARQAKMFQTPPTPKKLQPQIQPQPVSLRGYPKDWWKIDHRTKLGNLERATNICSVCGEFGWWSKTDVDYRCLEHRSK